MKKKIEDKDVVLIVDELSDDEGRYMFDVMVVIFNFDELFFFGNMMVYLLDMYFLNVINNKIVF